MVNYNNTADEIIESGTDTCILPIGSVEQHGPHLPIGTDYILAESFAQAIGKEMNCLVLPVQAYSTCYEHRGKMGSFWMKPETMYRVIADLVTGMREQGFKKIIILLSHGGIFIAGPVIRELNSIYPDIDVLKLDLVDFYLSKETAVHLECNDNLHAGEIETSLMMFLKKEYFRKEKAVDYIPDIPRSYLNNLPLLKVSPEGVWGRPSLASVEKGQIIFREVVKSSADFLVNLLTTLESKKYR
ncbi:MAG: creatininase family protein [Spirochaetales bacterium]|nr:creatininase family protein [Spirochaetales bacterium]